MYMPNIQFLHYVFRSEVLDNQLRHLQVPKLILETADTKIADSVDDNKEHRIFKWEEE